MKEEAVAGFSVGVIISLLINLFLIYGGSPQGMYWRIDDVKGEIEMVKKEYAQQVKQLDKKIFYLQECIIKEKEHRWYGE